ncbi:MAG: YCF48-related protein [Pseudomonadota bacterium]
MKSAFRFSLAAVAPQGSWRRVCVRAAIRFPQMSALALSFLALAAGMPASSATVDAFRDPLVTPAQLTKFAANSSLMALAHAGMRLVAVGARGLIIISDDAGASWRQTRVPVSSDLVAVRFVTPTQGFATGHDGVVLSTQDAGNTWIKRLDGRAASALLTAHFSKLAAAGDADAARLLTEVQRNYAEGPELPVLDVWFDTPERGWIVGAFGTILATDDGGQHWTSWIEKVDNKKMLHYNAVRRIGDDLFIASEQGIVFKFDRKRERFVALHTGYQGSFFGVTGTRDYVLAYGLRGSLYRSRDGGASWQVLASGVSGGLNDGVATADGRVLLVSQDGRLIVSRDQADSFKALTVPRPDVLTGVALMASGKVVLAGLRGAQIVALD